MTQLPEAIIMIALGRKPEDPESFVWWTPSSIGVEDDRAKAEAAVAAALAWQTAPRGAA